uniref:Acyl-CoA dehydrogenase n=1 Tax=uncultured bacterium AB_9 TaxID=1630012 RepID=A0A0E3JNM7_9BACT|nr:acyl-CoA dehydrogenase [uncultured bacterium AB_9]
MARNAAEALGATGVPSFTTELIAGNLRWDLLSPWPCSDPADDARADEAIALLGKVLRTVDPVTVDDTGKLPAELLADLRRHGLLAPGVPIADGGLGLTPSGVFRLVEAAARHTRAVSMTMAIEAAIGVGAYLPVLAEGPLRATVREALRAGALSGTADTEPSGAANRRRETVAVPTPDGTAYLVTGEKVYVGNAPIADLLWITATVRSPDRERVRTFLIRTDDPGVVVTPHEFMGLRGFPNGRITFTDVRVPADLVLVEEDDYEGRITPAITVMLSLGRLYLICAPALAIARTSLRLAGDFARTRMIDDRPLARYDAVRRSTADSLAEVFAIESVTEWCLLAGPVRGLNPLLEQNLAKNICSLDSWRTVDRTMSLLAAEGFETDRSRLARGMPAGSVDRLFRDARGLRISGGVDYLLDYWFSQMIVFAGARGTGPGAPAPDLRHDGLTPRNAEHLRGAAASTRALAVLCDEFAAEGDDGAAPADQQQRHIAIGATYRELAAMALCLARAQHLAAGGDETAQHLADVYCTAARRRIDDWWPQISRAAQPPYAAVSDEWIDHGRR